MSIVGLTGGIASGKSTVAVMLEEKGAWILDADKMAHQVMEPGKPAWEEIVDWLGRDILKEDSSINREAVGEIVFNDKKARRRLNSIVHPRVLKEMNERTKEIRNNQPQAVIIYDVPLLIEGSLHREVDWVLLVYTNTEIQRKRLRERDGLSEQEIENRLNAQMPLIEKKKYADFVIENNGTLETTRHQVDKFWEEITRNKAV